MAKSNKKKLTEAYLHRKMQYAKTCIERLGYVVGIVEDSAMLMFTYREEIVRYYPGSEWATGKSINDGRGLKRLLIQIKPNFK